MLELPCKITKLLTDKNATEHDHITFDICLSKPNHTVKWLINGVEIKDNNRIKPKQLDEFRFGLDIDDVHLEDAGPIKAVVFNDKGEEVLQSEANLNVKG